MDNKTYIKILSDTLSKKLSVLEDLISTTQLQETYITENPLDMELMGETLSRKEELILKLEQLDSGFERVYEHVREELQQDRQKYKEDIIILQKIINDITEKSAKLQALEIKNKGKLDLYLNAQKKNIKNFNVNNKTVASYYKNMSNQSPEQSYFLDKKN